MDDDDEEEEEEAMDGDPAAPPDGRPPALPGALPPTDCLFCCHHSRSLVRNVAHMTKAHSFFIPDVEFLADLRGLVRYLGEFPPGREVPSGGLMGPASTSCFRREGGRWEGVLVVQREGPLLLLHRGRAESHDGQKSLQTLHRRRRRAGVRRLLRFQVNLFKTADTMVVLR